MISGMPGLTMFNRVTGRHAWFLILAGLGIFRRRITRWLCRLAVSKLCSDGSLAFPCRAIFQGGFTIRVIVTSCAGDYVEECDG